MCQDTYSSRQRHTFLWSFQIADHCFDSGCGVPPGYQEHQSKAYCGMSLILCCILHLTHSLELHDQLQGLLSRLVAQRFKEIFMPLDTLVSTLSILLDFLFQSSQVSTTKVSESLRHALSCIFRFLSWCLSPLVQSAW